MKESLENNEKELRVLAKKVNDYLNPFVEEAFDIETRLNYMNENFKQYGEGIQEVEDRVENLGVEDEVSERLAEKTQKNFGEMYKAIEDIKPTETLNEYAIADYIKNIIDPIKILERNIKNIYKLDGVDSWVNFVQYLNYALKDFPSTWRELRKKSELN